MAFNEILASLPSLTTAELRVVQREVRKLQHDQLRNTVDEYIPIGRGMLQAERKVRKGAQYGPYWYYRYRDKSRMHSRYVGKMERDDAINLIYTLIDKGVLK